MRNKQIILVKRPVGAPRESDFRLVESAVVPPSNGEVLVKNLFLSLDPYMRGRMDDRRSYAAPVGLGDVMVGASVGEIIASNDPELEMGETVVGPLGWQQFAVSSGDAVTKVDARRFSPSVHLSVLGSPGVTAWYGLSEIGKPKAGETVVVSAASGAVGSVVGQLAKIRGCRAVGIAGGKVKCDYVVNEFGFDACLDHHDPELHARFEEATPDGVDIYFENVGGPILDMVLTRLNPFARIPLSGLVAQYNATEPYGVRGFASLLTNRVLVQGFITGEHPDRRPAALAELSRHVAEGRIRYRETIATGLESAPAAFIGMLEGKNLGKQLVRL